MCWSSNATLLIKSSEYDMDYTYLAENNIKTYTGKTEWNQRTVRDLITNVSPK